jgi:predicted peroxiredoxin
MARCSLIRNKQFRSRCDDIPRMKYLKRNGSLDGYIWVCKSLCVNTKKIRKDSFFEKSRLIFRQLFLIYYKCFRQDSYEDIAFEMNKDPQTISKSTDIARESICYYLCENGTKIGGINRDNPPKMVEIDESMFLDANITKEEQLMVNGLLVE